MSAAPNPSTDRPVKLGKSSKDTQGNTVLVNPQGKAFAINIILRKTWDMLDGTRTVEQVAEELVDAKENHEGYRREDLQEIVRRLYEANLAN